MRLPRMTTRRWLVAVAIVAVGVGASMLIMRSRSYAALAAFHADSEDECRRIAEAFGGGPFDAHIWRDAIALARRRRRLIPYHAALRRKYELASRRPWLSVEPDPPEPEP